MPDVCQTAQGREGPVRTISFTQGVASAPEVILTTTQAAPAGAATDRGLDRSAKGSAMNEDASQVRTTLPCPNWCVLPTGHGFHSLTHEGLLMRCHEGPDPQHGRRGDRPGGRRDGAAMTAPSPHSRCRPCLCAATTRPSDGMTGRRCAGSRRRCSTRPTSWTGSPVAKQPSVTRGAFHRDRRLALSTSGRRKQIHRLVHRQSRSCLGGPPALSVQAALG